MGDNRNYAALEWVIGEIREALNDARQTLEAYVEDPRDSTKIRFCLTYIHQVLGSLKMIEFQGASLFAEEMERLAQAIMNDTVVSMSEAEEVLMRALLQLPIYLDHVSQYRDDHPGIVLPLLNDLRAARKKGYLSETNLFSPDLSQLSTVSGSRHAVTENRAKLKQVLKKLRMMYQYAAASVLRGIKIDENLAYIRKVFERLEGITRGTQTYALWEASTALVDALIEDEIELSVAVKGLLRHLARELKILEENCPSALDAPVRERLMRNILYYIARSESVGSRIPLVKKRYQLDNALFDGAVEGRKFDRNMISAPEPDAIRSVVVALQDELNSVKHLLGMAISGQGTVSDLEEVLPIVKRVGDTLAVLGIADLRRQTIEQSEKIEAMCVASEIDDEQISNIASSIVEIEHRLEAIGKSVSKSRDFSHVDERKVEIDEAKDAVIGECRVGLEKFKESIVEFYSSDWSSNCLEDVPDLIAHIYGGLKMVPLSRAAAIVERCGAYVKEQFIHNPLPPDGTGLVKLAYAIEGVDYYLERMSTDHGEEINRFLDLAEESLAELEYPVDKPGDAASEEGLPETRTIPEPETQFDGLVDSDAEELETSSDSDAMISDASPETSIDATTEDLVENTDSRIEDEAENVETPEASSTVTEPAEDEEPVDDEIIEIFIEEAGEVMETLHEYLPQWENNFGNDEALSIVRRGFHTLKGSGRMVKAMDVGELAWSVENMLNRVIDGTVPALPAHIVFIKQVMALIPTVVKAFEDKVPNPEKSLCESYMAIGEQFSKGEVPEGYSDPEQVLGDVAHDDAETVDQDDSDITVADSELLSVEEEADDDNDEDQVLLELFASEAETHLAAVDEFIAEMDLAAPIFTPPSDKLQRALHTLKGSAHMANVHDIATLAVPLELFMKEMRVYQINMNDDILQLLKDAAVYTREGLAMIAAREPVRLSKLDMFVARANELRDMHVAHLVKKNELQPDDHKQVDPQMLSIFMAEEMSLLLDADQILARWREAPEVTDELPALVEELATLEEGAYKANLPEMAKLCAELQKIYRAVLNGEIVRDAYLFDTLGQCHDTLLDMVDGVAAGQTLEAPPANIQEAIDTLLLNLQASPASEADELTGHVGAADLSADLTDRDIEEEEGLGDFEPFEFDSADALEEQIASLDSSPASEAANESDEVAEDVEFVIEQADVSAPEVAVSEEIPVETPVHTAVSSDDDDYDSDILEVFLEEAEELIEELEEAMHGWEKDIENTESIDIMKRALHTLKGGARLTGLKQLGELTHEFETYIINTKDPASDPNFFSLMHNFQDQILFLVKNVRAKVDGEDVDLDALPIQVPTLDSAEDTEPKGELLEADSSETDELDTEVVEDVDTPVEPIVPPASTSRPAAMPALQDDEGFTMPPPPATQRENANQIDFSQKKKSSSQEVVKISADLLEELVNLAGETSIGRGRLEQQVADFGASINEVDGTLRRLQEQLRRLDIETEAQMLFRQEQLAENEEFDPLEMDRYSQLQQLSRSLAESASDLVDLKTTLSDKVKDTEALLLQQSRVNSSLQEGLMRARMVPFSRMVPRLRRIVRQVSSELGKQVNFELDNVEGEMDRSVLEHMVAPLEHMLRNAVDHGIEAPQERLGNGKPETGRILLSFAREGGDILLRLADDGRGIALEKVKEKAIERGLMAEDADLSDHDIMQFILQAGFSTAENVTQISGRGVGMDVVAAEIKQLGGSMSIESKSGVGTQFTVRLPFTVSVNRALMVEIGNDHYAIPLNTIEGIVRVSPFELEHYYSQPDARFEYAGDSYQVRYLGSTLYEDATPKLDGQVLPLPVILVRSAQHTMAFQVDSLMGSREIVVKSLGVQFATVQGVSGATVMGDGSVVVILDPHALVRRVVATAGLEAPTGHQALQTIDEEPVHKTIMVVDDSVTVRKVTTRFLEREGFNVITAKDGVDALQVLQEHIPDLMLLDIEMPRMDGFEVAKNVRTTQQWADIPIIMITSRTGDKHREHALSIGVNNYLGKPYQEEMLLECIGELLETQNA